MNWAAVSQDFSRKCFFSKNSGYPFLEMKKSPGYKTQKFSTSEYGYTDVKIYPEICQSPGYRHPDICLKKLYSREYLCENGNIFENILQTWALFSRFSLRSFEFHGSLSLILQIFRFTQSLSKRPVVRSY